MTQRSVTYLKARFENNDIPTQSDYQDVFDSFVSLESSASQTLGGTLNLIGIDASRVSAAVVSANTMHVNSYTIHSHGTVSAGAGTQAAAPRVSADNTIVYGNDVLGFGIVVSTAEPGRIQHITNTNTTALSVFPASGCNFIGTAENAAISLAVNQTLVLTHLTASAYGVNRGGGV
jgi:hypothetical protein